MKTLNEQIDRLRDVLVTCYKAIKRKGGTIPEAGERNMTNLPAAVLSIPQTHGVLTNLEVTANGEYLPADHDADGFSKVTAKFHNENATPFEYKEVTFIDHLGVIADYTIEEVMALTELPTPKEYDNLTFDYWTKTLEEIQDGQKHVVAAIYHTTDGSVRFKYSTEFSRKLSFTAIVEGNYFDIDWGDGTYSEHVSDDAHIYDKDGIYHVKVYGGTIRQFNFSQENLYNNIGIISLELPNTITSYDLFNGSSNGRASAAPLLEHIVLAPSQNNIRLFLPSAMKCKYLAIPNNVDNMVFLKGLQSVECFNIPSLVTSFNNAYDWSNLRKIVFDGTCKSFNLGNNTAREVDITIKEGVGTISGKMNYFHSRRIETPNSLSSIPDFWIAYSAIDEVIINGTPTFNGNNTFRESHIQSLHFTSLIPPVLSSYNVFYDYNRYNYEIYIPLGAKETYENDTNWAAAIAAGFITLIEE